MNKLLQQSGALFLALLIMLSTVSFTVDLHICGGSVVDLSFAQEELSCSSSLMGELTEEVHNAMRNMGCCDDLQFQIEGQDELQHSFLSFQIDNPVFVLANQEIMDVEWIDNSGDLHLYTSYIPPPLIQDVLILNQTFLL